MSTLKVNAIQRATTGSSAVTFTEAVIITTGSISASVITVGTLTASLLINGDVPKEKLTNDAREWVNILNRPGGLLSSSAGVLATISGTSVAFANITASGIIFTSGSFSGSGASITNIPNAGLTNSNITINGTSVSLGGTRNIATNEVSESVNLYYTDARVKTKLSAETVVSSSGQINYQSITGQPSINTLGSDGNKSFTLTSGLFITASGGADGVVLTNDTSNYILRLRTVGGTVSSSAQVQAALPANLVSSSAQINTGSFSGSLTGTFPYASLTSIPGGIVSASAQITLTGITGTTFSASNYTFPNNLIVGGTLIAQEIQTEYVSSSIIYESGSTKFGDTDDDIMSVTGSILVLGGRISGSMVGMFSSSAQVDYNSITNKLSGVVSGAAQVVPLLPGGTVSSSGQVDASATANFATAVAAQLGTVHSGSYLGTATTNNLAEGGSNLYYTDARVKTKMSAEDAHSGSYLGTATTNNLTEGGSNLYFTNARVLSYVDSLSVVSSSGQIKPLLPGGTVSSSTQISPVLVNSSSYAVTASFATSVSGTLAADTDGLPEGSSNLYYTDARVKTKISTEVVHSGSYLGTATTTNLTEGTNLYLTTPRVASALPAGTLSSSAQFPGWVTASSQIDYNSITNKLSGVVSGAAQFNALSGTSASFATTASAATSITFTPTTASFATTASAANSITFTPTTASFAVTASFTTNVPVTASFAISASHATAANTAITASFSTTASAANSITFTPTTASYADTSSNITGGSTNYIPLWSSTSAVSSSIIYQAGINLGINNTIPSASLHISGTLMVQQVVEKLIVTGSAPTATTNIDITSGSIHYRSGSTTAHWTVNFRGDAGTTLNSVMYNGQSLTLAAVVNHAGTPYSASAHQIDGVAITPRWQSGLVPSASGNSTDFYAYTIFKIASASYNLFASQTKFS